MEQQETIKKEKTSVVKRVLVGIVTLFAAAAGGVLLYLGITWFGLRPVITAEYGEAAPDAEQFGTRAAAYAEQPVLDGTGIREVSLQLTNGKRRRAWLWVRDTKAPTAVAVERTVSTLTRLKPVDLIDQLEDADLVRVSFAEEPPFGTAGDFPVRIYLEDRSGNRSSVESLLHIRVTNDGLAMEAGAQIPNIRDFLYDDYTVDCVTGLDETVAGLPGEHTVTVTVGGADYTSTLTVIDTVPPRAEVQTVIATPGSEIRAEDFLVSVQDATAVTAEILDQPDPDSRDFQTVDIRLTDLGQNETVVQAGLLYTFAKPVTVEARTNALTAEECLQDVSYEYAVFIHPFVPNHVGRFAVALDVDGDNEIALVDVVDTTAPAVRARDITWYLDHPLAPEDMLTAVSDATDTVIALDTEIDWGSTKDQQVKISVSDEGGNRTDTAFTLRLVRDQEAPKIYGVQNRTVYIGEPTAYLAELFAVDAVDGETEITVDTSKVDRNKAGSYPVTYTATDRSGNTATATCQFRFIRAAVTEEDLKAKASSIVRRVTTEEMTMTEKLVAVYDYVYSHVRYNGYSDKSDWRKEAMKGLTKGTGDCFTFYATLRALLDETDIPYMSVTRKGGYTRHFWLIVNVGTGWYHLDANHNGTANWKCFMWTNSQCATPPGFWNYEHSIFPEIATEPFRTTDVIRAEKEALQ